MALPFRHPRSGLAKWHAGLSLEVVVQQTMDRRQLSASTTSQSMMSSDTIPRPLTLHISALSNEEFELYTRSLEELATLDNTVTGSSRTSSHSSYYEQLSFNSGDIRAWLKGRYPYVTIEKIDSVSHLNSPS